MHGNKDKPIIGWLALAVASRWHGAIAVMHPIDLDEHQPCFGVTLDQRWLCGSDGTVTLFDSMATATRFLHLLNVDRIAKGEYLNCDISGQEAFQCFQLGARGILPCNKCRNENAPHSHTSHDNVRWKARW